MVPVTKAGLVVVVVVRVLRVLWSIGLAVEMPPRPKRADQQRCGGKMLCHVDVLDDNGHT